MTVEVDDKSGFCFGVVNAISKAEEFVGTGLVSLGDIVHNGAEVARLEELGLETVSEDADLSQLAGRTVLIRAHGEPPSTYEKAHEYGIALIDATCPVVAKLQKTVAKAYAKMRSVDGQVVIFGRRGHAEVRGLAGQAAGNVIVVENASDLNAIDFARPVYFLAQTTSSLAEFERLGEEMRRRRAEVTIHDTVCRQVAGREGHLAGFARRFDAVVFVAGAKSSNGRVLFEAVRMANSRSYKIESAGELRPEWFEGIGSVGVCGATSTPKWLMTEIAETINSYET
jgi:4-hydroxy-3-methylbut-2-enyl diphosphate reductase